MNAQSNIADTGRGPLALFQRLVNWFIPASLLHSQTNRGLARVFVQTHLLGAVVSALMLWHLASLERTPDPGIYALGALVLVFVALPFALRRIGDMSIVSLVSFQVLGIVALIGTFQYGGFGSPFLPWLLVSLLSGLFYHSKRTGLVIGLFVADLVVFFAILAWHQQPALLPAGDVKLLSWISIGVAMTYMAFMALYYSHIIASRAELQEEAERYRAAALELEQARIVAEQLNLNRSKFFSKMSHELRTPLNAIIGYSEILLEDSLDDPHPNAQRDADLGRINATGKHLLSLVSEVLDADNLESATMAVEFGEFTLGQLCDDVAATAQPLVVANGNKFVIDCPLRQDYVRSDVKKLRQMLINLLSNAAKFTTGGTVTLELWLERGMADDRLHAAVRDTGIGIAPEVLPQLFETYMQADATIQGRFGGTGLGLALTRKFSVLLGGQITATSRLGEGSCFTIDIPAELKARDHGEADIGIASEPESCSPTASGRAA
jgi:signal transduction histidine kinase